MCNNKISVCLTRPRGHFNYSTLRKFERSSVSKLSDVSASFIAARVVLFGFSETKASSTLSTRLLRLRLCLEASIRRRSSKFSLNLNEVCFLVTDGVFIIIPFCSAKIVHLYNTNIRQFSCRFDSRISGFLLRLTLRKRFAVRTLLSGSIPSALRYNKSPPCGELSIVELEGLVPYTPNIAVSIKYRCLIFLCNEVVTVFYHSSPTVSQPSRKPLLP